MVGWSCLEAQEGEFVQAMGTNHVYQTEDGEDTEWDIIQRRLGNFKPKPEKWKPDPYQAEEEVSKHERKYLDEQDEEELEDLEDEFRDDRFLEEYRQKRLEEMRARAGVRDFGGVAFITGSDFVKEVTNAGEGVKVVVVLYKNRHERSERILGCMEEVASQFPTTKFVKIIATDCIKGYPDHNVPTVLVYENTNCKHTVVGVKEFGGDKMNSETVVAGLQKYGAIDQPKQVSSGNPQFRALSSDDEDSDF